MDRAHRRSVDIDLSVGLGLCRHRFLEVEQYAFWAGFDTDEWLDDIWKGKKVELIEKIMEC